jgi:hypothetical protein
MCLTRCPSLRSLHNDNAALLSHLIAQGFHAHSPPRANASSGTSKLEQMFPQSPAHVVTGAHPPPSVPCGVHPVFAQKQTCWVEPASLPAAHIPSTHHTSDRIALPPPWRAPTPTHLGERAPLTVLGGSAWLCGAAPAVAALRRPKSGATAPCHVTAGLNVNLANGLSP